MEAPDNLSYIKLSIDRVNQDSNPKNILMMQQSINALRKTSGMGNAIKEDGIMGKETSRAIKEFKKYDEKITNFKVFEALQERRKPFFKEEGNE